MKITASAGRKKVDIRDHCESLKLVATFGNEPELLAAIYLCLVFGGTLRAHPLNGEAVEIEFPGPPPLATPAPHVPLPGQRELFDAEVTQ